MAEQAGLPVLRWHDPALDSSLDSGSIGNRDLFDRAEITVCGFEDFKRQVEQQARRLCVSRSLPTPLVGHEGSVSSVAFDHKGGRLASAA